MKQTFYDLMDTYSDDSVELEDANITDADRVMALTMKNLGPKAVSTSTRKEKARPIRKGLRIGLIAAMFALALSVTAFAVYQAQIKDYIIPEPTPTTETASAEAPSHEAATAEASQAPEITAEPVRANISLVGYQGTPEYEAYVEWSNYLADWRAENPNPWAALGVDDTYHEAPYNYGMYNAYFQEQADKLDEIMDKYGLTLHETTVSLYAREELYDALGVKPFISDDLALDFNDGGYLYNDGTFKLELPLERADGGDLWCTIFNSVKGTITMIEQHIDLTDGYDEWSYQTASGETVDLVMTKGGSLILFETNGSYINVGVEAGSETQYPTDFYRPTKEEYLDELAQLWGPEAFTQEEIEEFWASMNAELDWSYAMQTQPAITKEYLEAIADSIDFSILAKRFDGSISMTQTSATIADFVVELENATDTYNRDDFADEAIAALGDFYLADIPEGYKMYIVSGGVPSDIPGDDYYYVGRRYDGPTGGELVLSWSDELEITDSGASREMITVEHVTVNGYDAICELEEHFTTITWIDTARQLKFSVHCSWSPISAEELITIAESVTEQ